MDFLKKSSGLFAALAIMAATIVLFQTAFTETFKAWQQEEYSHGYLVPLVGLMLILYKAKDLNVPHRNSWWGLAAFAFCLVCLFLFEIAGIRGIQPLLLVAFLYSVFLTSYGVRYTWAMAAPLGFFIFLAPLPKFMYYKLSFNMQLISTDLSVLMFYLVDISVFQEGNIIDLGIIKMEVAEACNGLRYLFPLMALGYLMAFMYKAPFWKRALLFVSTVPITIILNSLRIFLIGVSANVWGAEVASGIVHDVEGWVVFFACFLVLIVEIIVLKKIGNGEQVDFDCFTLPTKENWSKLSLGQWRLPVKAMIVVMAVLACLYSFAVSKGWGDIKPVPLERPFAQFPMQISEWIGRPGAMDLRSLEILGSDEYLLADYRTRQGDFVNLYMLYYPKQDSTSSQAIHSPEVCIPGGGWEVESQAASPIILPNGDTLIVNKMIIGKGLQKQLVYFWFIQNDIMSHDANMAKITLIKNTVLEGRANGAMIRLTTLILDDDYKDAEARLNGFLQDSFPTIKGYF